MAAPPVISVIYSALEPGVPGVVCCAGYEQGKWRTARLAKHLLDWLPDCALTAEEKAAIEPLTPYRTLETAARRFFKTDAKGPRGELGELLIHALCVQEFKTRQFVARLFYKMRTNNTITGFDIVHLKYDAATDQLELWLGEAKFHKDFDTSLSSALKTLSDHVDAGFLEETKALIGPKISASDPLREKLAWVFDANVSLDEVTDRMVVPVLIAANCEADPVGSLPASYSDDVKSRLTKMQQTLHQKYGAQLDIVAIYLPLNDKDALEAEFNSRLEALT